MSEQDETDKTEQVKPENEEVKTSEKAEPAEPEKAEPAESENAQQAKPDEPIQAKPKRKRKKWPFIVGGIVLFLFIAYWVVVYFLVSAALVPEFMRKLESFSTLTEKEVANQKHTDDIEKNSRKELDETELWWESIHKEKLTITSEDGYKLVAAYIPAEKESHDWVLVLHGYTGLKEEMYPFARQYWLKGYNALVPDLRCQGESEGDFIGMGCTDSVDCMLWLKEILKRDPEARIVLHGQSMGAATALIMTGMEELPSAVRAVVSDCSYTDAYNMFKAKIRDWFSLPAFPLVNSARLMLKMRGGYDLYDASAIEAVKQSHTPTLFIHGTDDMLISAEMSKELYEAEACSKKELLLIEGAGHAQAQDKDPELYYSTIFTFLDAVD